MPRRPRPTLSPPWWRSPGTIKIARIVATIMLLWGINVSLRPDNTSLFSEEGIHSEAAMSLPRKLKAPGIVTYVDHRKADDSATNPPEENNKKQQQQQQNPTKFTKILKPTTKRINKTLQEWRETYNRACQNRDVILLDLLDIVQQIYRPGTDGSNKRTKKRHLKSNIYDTQPCKYSFLDFGANIGDSLGKFIDSGLDNCDSPRNEIHNLSPKYNLEQGFMDQFHDKENALVRYSRYVTRKAGRGSSPERYPEQYCYFGVEGNPVFTERLEALQDQVNEASPKPVRNAQFFTETVGAGQDGPTVLFLDTVSAENNFWGSSLLSEPKYVRESAHRFNDGKPIEARVTGVTLSTMVKRTVIPEPNAHLIIKMDIEGGEFAVLKEAYRSGVLCNYVKKGVIVNMLLEMHAPQFKAANLDMNEWNTFTKGLAACGVIIQGGMNAG